MKPFFERLRYRLKRIKVGIRNFTGRLARGVGFDSRKAHGPADLAEAPEEAVQEAERLDRLRNPSNYRGR